MLTPYDYFVIAMYFIFMVSIGVAFRSATKDTSDYFRGGGQMLWWIVGSSAFMTQFSAWTFTGAAGKAYENGIVVMVFYVANAVGFFINYLGTAQRLRQMRIITTLEGIRQRWDGGSEQFFIWLSIPVGILTSGIALNGLGVILSSVFGIPLTLTILGAGLLVVVMTTMGGSWAATASDFIQMLLLMAVTAVTAVYALQAVGGVGEFIAHVPSASFTWGSLERSSIMALWILAVFLKQFLVINNMSDGYRYLCAKDDRHARRGALLATGLFIVGPLIWFIPPMAARVLYPDLQAVPALQVLGTRVVDGAYLAISLDVLPQGMIGLLITGLFAATVSTMDTGLNKNTGMFIRSFYLTVLRPRAAERELVTASKLTTILFGALVILSGLYFSRLHELSLFNLMMQFTGLVSVPIAVPLMWGIFYRRTPSWSGWSTVVVGLLVSLVMGNLTFFLGPDAYQRILFLDTPAERGEMSAVIFLLGVIGNLVIGSLWFLSSSRWYDREPVAYREKITAFFERMRRPVDYASEHGVSSDRAQLRILGRLSLAYGVFVLLLTLIPNTWGGRAGFLAVGLLIGGIGALLLRASRRAS
ncbi:MAG: sodium:solute symporter family transporter [Verrucomicrobiota bacterium]